MSRTVIAAAWSERAATPEQAATVLRRLERACHRTDRGLRTAIATLVAVVPVEHLPAARRALRALADAEAVRVVLLAAGYDGDAEVTVRRIERAGSTRSASEVVAPVAAGAKAGEVADAVAATRLPAAPVVAWLAGDGPQLAAVLAEVAERLIVDTRPLEGEAAGALVAAADPVPVADLGWLALRPWRQLVAGLFAGPDFGMWPERITSGAVRGDAGVRRLLAGWLLTRLPITPPALHAGDGPTAVELHAGAGGPAATFVVASAGGDAVVASAVVAGGPAHRRHLVVPVPSTAELLRAALAEPDSGPVWRAALAAGRAWSGA